MTSSDSTRDGAKLLYHGTANEVRLGDRVLMKRLFRKAMPGTVTYIPGISAPHPEMEWPEFSRWAIELDDGTVMSWPYLPDELQPSSRITLLARGSANYKGLQPGDELK